MDNEQYDDVINSLVDFIIRVSKGNVRSETEVSVLPEVVRALKEWSEC